jgi:hypothetical protein
MCTLCRDDKDQALALASQTWDCTYGGLARTDGALTEDGAIKCLKAERPSGVIEPFTISTLKLKPQADLTRAQHVFTCAHGRTTNWKTAPRRQDQDVALLRGWEAKLREANLAMSRAEPRGGTTDKSAPDSVLQEVEGRGEPDMQTQPEQEEMIAGYVNDGLTLKAQFAILRRDFDGRETLGYQRTGKGRPIRTNPPPDWIFDRSQLHRYTRRLKSHGLSDFEIRRRVRALYLYHRCRFTAPEVALELEMETIATEKLLDRCKKFGDNLFNGLEAEQGDLETSIEESQFEEGVYDYGD